MEVTLGFVIHNKVWKSQQVLEVTICLWSPISYFVFILEVNFLKNWEKIIYRPPKSWNDFKYRCLLCLCGIKKCSKVLLRVKKGYFFDWRKNSHMSFKSFCNWFDLDSSNTGAQMENINHVAANRIWLIQKIQLKRKLGTKVSDQKIGSWPQNWLTEIFVSYSSISSKREKSIDKDEKERKNSC